MRGKIPTLLIRGLVATESILFLAIAVALAAIAVVQILSQRTGV